MLIKKLYDKLATRVNAIDTIDINKLDKKADYDTVTTGNDDKFPSHDE